MEESSSKSSALRVLKLVALILVLILLPFAGFILGRNSIPTPVKVVTEISPTPTPIPDPTENWRTFTGEDFTFKFPYLWKTEGDQFVSEVSFTPGLQVKTRTYNIVEAKKYETPLFSGYSNEEWFDKINSQNSDETVSDQKISRTKIGSGVTETGEPYVIFKEDPSSTAVTITTHQVKAYILKEPNIYLLTLDLYDLNGLNIFQKLVPTFETTNNS